MGNSFDALSFRSHERELMKRYLHDFLVSQRSSSKEHDVVRRHWQQLHHLQSNETLEGLDEQPALQTPPIVRLYDTFYGFLFDLAPRFKPLLCDTASLKEKFLTSVFAVLRSVVVDSNQQVIERIRQLALRLFQAGMKCECLNVFGHVIMLTLQSLAPRLWTSEVEQCWRSVYCHVALLALRDLQQLQDLAHQKNKQEALQLQHIVISVRYALYNSSSSV